MPKLANRLVIQAALTTLVALAAFVAHSDAADTREPTDPSASAAAQVQKFHSALMDSTRLEVDYGKRSALLGEALDAVFDVPRIARISAGASWRKLEPAGQESYTALLRDVIVGTYVSRFDADRGQQLSVLETTEVKPGRHVVRAEILRPTGARVALDYYLRDNRVFNVVADGVSDLSVRRADYAAIIKADGFPALLAHLEAQLSAARSSLTAGSEPEG